MDPARKTSYILSKYFFDFTKKKNNNQGPENVLECEGGNYLDLQYKYNKENNKKVNLMMKKLEDEYISRLNRNSINQKSLKKAIFSGKVIIIKKSIEVTKIINLVERYVNDFFNCSVSTIQNEFHYSKENHKFLTILQSRIKNCKLIKNTFTLF